LASLHNVRFYLMLMEGARAAIDEGRFGAFRAGQLARWAAGGVPATATAPQPS
jgi:queuine/archaeosine tRNA-ribosyltransferase